MSSVETYARRNRHTRRVSTSSKPYVPHCTAKVLSLILHVSTNTTAQIDIITPYEGLYVDPVAHQIVPRNAGKARATK